MKRDSVPYLSMLMALVLTLLSCSAVSQSNTARAGTTSDSSIERGLVGYWTFNNVDMKWTSDTAGVAYRCAGNRDVAAVANELCREDVAVASVRHGGRRIDYTQEQSWTIIDGDIAGDLYFAVVREAGSDE